MHLRVLFESASSPTFRSGREREERTHPPLCQCLSVKVQTVARTDAFVSRCLFLQHERDGTLPSSHTQRRGMGVLLLHFATLHIAGTTSKVDNVVKADKMKTECKDRVETGTDSSTGAKQQLHYLDNLWLCGCEAQLVSAASCLPSSRQSRGSSQQSPSCEPTKKPFQTPGICMKGTATLAQQRKVALNIVFEILLTTCRPKAHRVFHAARTMCVWLQLQWRLVWRQRL